MSREARNNFGVGYATIKWVEAFLSKHKNVRSVHRQKDILFTVERYLGCHINLVCLNEYTCGITRVLEVLDDFRECNLIHSGGNWSGYTLEAKEYCLEAKIGLFNTDELGPALHREKFWQYHRVDEKGKPSYPYRAAGS